MFTALRKIVNNMSMKRAWQIIKPTLQWLKDGNEDILDFGSGIGHIGLLISQLTGRKITFLDIRKFPFTCPEVNVNIYDGKIIPYPNLIFNTTIIFLVLHHTPDPKLALKEVIRVSKNNIVLCEDLLTNKKQIIVETIKDTIANGFLPHMTLQYKTEAEWEELFRDLGLTIKDKTYNESTFVFKFKHVYWLLSANYGRDLKQSMQVVTS